MKSFDDFKEIVIKDEKGKPKIGGKVKGKQIKRAKLISGVELTQFWLNNTEVDDALQFKSHPNRCFLFWMIET